ncbi:ADP-ribosylation factor-like protein 2 [Cymbomonas tetramitiformis]|uniref:ADP-ribosylation factor-like protein 2 n=1 Tax=Cymbomonas tetramitiformis TaxID=36881 RepID=A0AAE0H004_9CHLO|nr:ADP-ribosylation factor-like protein 2 [Cymbomonas tetramitiformis]
MGLLTIIKKVKAKEREIRLLMVGLDNAGKTTIVKRMNGEDISSISPTLGFNIKSMSFKGFTLNVWDVGGQKTLRSYWRNYYERTDGMIWVIDSADIRRLEDCRDELHKLLVEEKLAGASLLILANKQDISGALSPSEIEKVLQMEKFSSSRHWRILGCSAVTGDGLLDGFDWVVSDIASRIYLFD